MHLFQRPDSGACSASAGVLIGPHWARCSVAWSSHCVVGTASHEAWVCLLEWGRGLLHSWGRQQAQGGVSGLPGLHSPAAQGQAIVGSVWITVGPWSHPGCWFRATRGHMVAWLGFVRSLRI